MQEANTTLTQDINCTLARATADSELLRVCTNVSVPVCRWGWQLELQTKVREDFTITARDCETFAILHLKLY